jgi:uncharacterized protein (DUF488 family)
VIYTIGHSNRSAANFLDLLNRYEVKAVVDIRTIPKSRHNPQYNKEELDAFLTAQSIEYVHQPLLGGLRHPLKESPNGGWRNSSFRGYADYMLTPQFEEGLLWLIDFASKKVVAIMCAEAVYWRCHRQLVSDALIVRNILASHILSPTKAEPHRLTPFANVKGTFITYPPQQASLDFWQP